MFEVNELNVGYGQSEVIHSATFNVQKAEILAIMGRNGMGKTTLLKSLMGVLSSKSGTVKVDGKDVSAMASHERVRNGLAYVPQGRMIFGTLSVFENLISGAKGKVSKKALDEIYALFPVLFDMRKRRGGNLSGGQQQQLAIGRALITEPKFSSSTNRLKAFSPPSSRISPARCARFARCGTSRSSCPSKWLVS